MKKEKSQRIQRKYKNPEENTMNNYTATSLTIWKKWTIFWNLTACQNWIKQKQTNWTDRSLEKKLNMSSKHSLQIKAQDQMASQAHSTKHTKRIWCPSSLNFFERLKKKEHSQRHSMMPPSPSFQNQTEIPPKKKTIAQYHWWI